MGYRDLGNIDDLLIRTIMHMGAECGVQKISSKKLAASCNIATSTIFKRFGTMQAALDAAAQSFDRLHMEMAAQMVQENMSAEQIWDRMMDCFLADPDGTLYYVSYVNVFGFDPTIHNPRAQEFLEIIQVLLHPDPTISDDECLLIWDYITSMAFYYAEKFIHYVPYTETNKEIVKRIAFTGAQRMLTFQKTPVRP